MLIQNGFYKSFDIHNKNDLYIYLSNNFLVNLYYRLHNNILSNLLNSQGDHTTLCTKNRMFM